MNRVAKPKVSQGALDATLAQGLRWLARHICRDGKSECPDCQRALVAISVLREWGAKSEQEKGK